jgi:hypothetical protein
MVARRRAATVSAIPQIAAPHPRPRAAGSLRENPRRRRKADHRSAAKPAAGGREASNAERLQGSTCEDRLSGVSPLGVIGSVVFFRLLTSSPAGGRWRRDQALRAFFQSLSSRTRRRTASSHELGQVEMLYPLGTGPISGTTKTSRPSCFPFSQSRKRSSTKAR